MQKRNPIMVLVLFCITFGIYGIYWLVKTKGEMNEQGADIPTAWLIILPVISIYWYWKFSEGVEKVTKKELSAPISFVLAYFLGIIGIAITQNSLNKAAA